MAIPVVQDPTVYPIEERVGEDILQRWIVELLRPLVERWLRERGDSSFVGADQFIYFEQYNPHERVAPDVYILPGVAPVTEVTAWKAWLTGIVPSFAFECVSKNWQIDYIEAPLAHQRLGTSELIVFDPHYSARRDGVRWQRYNRAADDRFEKTQRTNADRIYSETLACFLRVQGMGLYQRVRLATGETGDEFFPTAEEAEREAKEVERLAKEAERQPQGSGAHRAFRTKAAFERARVARQGLSVAFRARPWRSFGDSRSDLPSSSNLAAQTLCPIGHLRTCKSHVFDSASSP
jgi:hypothetical protein